jgi:hypothetical protein
VAEGIAAPLVRLTTTEVIGILQISDADVQWLVNTGQLTPREIGNNQIFNSVDVWRLIQTYRDVAHRRSK